MKPWAITVVAILLLTGKARPGIFFAEGFEDTELKERGWYDNTKIVLSTEHRTGGNRSAEFRWKRGSRTPETGGGLRRKFAPSESVYVSFRVKYSTNYTGSNRPYHPHEFNLLTTENGDYAGPAFSRLTGYIEHNEGIPVLALQDGQNIDQARIGQDLRGITENRAVSGCNGNRAEEGSASVSCYRSGAAHWNGKVWKAPRSFFQDAPGLYYKSDWHQVEAYFQLNTLADGIGQPDGQLKYWYDGTLIIDRTNIIMRTGAHPNMKWNQLLIAPYIGDGAPVDQAMWVDDLRLGSERPTE